MRVLFLGTPGRFAARALWSCLSAGHDVSEFWYGGQTRQRTWRSDRRLGFWNPAWSVSAALRRFQIEARPVPPLRKAAELWELPCVLSADVLISAEFPYIVPAALLEKFGDRAVNLHPALLPDYRGPLPILWMLHREETARCGGVTLHQMSAQLDTGPVIAQRHVPWNTQGFRAWEADLCCAAGDLVREELGEFLSGRIVARSQEGEQGSYFRRMDPQELKITTNLTTRRVQHLLDSIGSFASLYARVDSREIRVASFGRVIASKPTGQPPKIGPWNVEFDVADARIVLRRWLPGTSKLRQWRTFRYFAQLNASVITRATCSTPVSR